MTDEENKRQRHLAEMLIAECDGKTVELKLFSQSWKAATGLLWWICEYQTQIENGDALLRIKPEPREWWICLRCHQQFENAIGHHATNSSGGAICGCPAVPVHVREVLND